jgi:hypothetical protein
VHEHAGVGDPEAGRPADVAKAFRQRLGDDDVARDDDHRFAQLGKAHSPGIHREHNLVGPKRPGIGADRGADAVPEVAHRGPLVNPDAALEGNAAKPPGEFRRLNRGRALLEDSR